MGWFPASYVKELSGSRASSNRSTPEPMLYSRFNENLNGGPQQSGMKLSTAGLRKLFYNLVIKLTRLHIILSWLRSSFKIIPLLKYSATSCIVTERRRSKINFTNIMVKLF